MKFLSILSILALAITVSSCTKSGSSDITGKWKLFEVKIQYLDDMQKMAETQLQSLKDSAAMVVDTAAKAMFEMQASQMQQNIDDFKKQQDSSMKSTFWSFKADSIFEISEAGHSTLGKWWYDEKKMRLFTTRESAVDSVDIKMEADTLTLQFDSINYMNMVRVKE